MRFFRGMLRRALGLLGTLASTLLGLTTLGPGCGGEAPDQAAIRPASAPALKADGPDLADRDCRVVLRRAARVSGPTGPLVHQGPDGESWWVWEAIVDLSEELVSAGARPVVLFAPWGGPEWYEAAQADEIAGAEEGFRRYRILLTEHTISPSHVSTTGLSQFVLEMVPAALLPDGTRLFDHNPKPPGSAPPNPEPSRKYTSWAAGGRFSAAPSSKVAWCASPTAPCGSKGARTEVTRDGTQNSGLGSSRRASPPAGI